MKYTYNLSKTSYFHVFVLVSVTVMLSGTRADLSNKSGLTPESNLANQDIVIMHKLGGVRAALTNID